ncbi:MAG: DUF2219 family protein [Bacteroidia bacterium]
MRSVSLLLLFVLVFLQSGIGQSVQTISFYFDNDLLYFPLNEDRDYTFGMGIAFGGGQGSANPAGYLLNLADRATKISNWHKSAYASTFSTRWEVKLFTPDNLRISHTIFRDRPYASVFSVTTSRISSNPVKGILIQSSLEAGLLGLFLAKNVQGGAHALSRKITGHEYPYKPMGWQNQISQGGEPTFRYAVSIDKKLLPFIWKSRNNPETEHFSISSTASAEAGYLTSVSAGISSKLGWINTTGSTARKQEFFFHGSYQCRLQAYNALLQGQFRHSEHRISYSNLNILIRQWEAGITWRKNRFATGYTLCYRSAEISNTNHPNHYFGQWTMIYQL